LSTSDQPKLSRVRKAGLLEYGKPTQSYTVSFDRKWVHPIERPNEPLLGTGDMQSLADLGNSFALVDAMMVAPHHQETRFTTRRSDGAAAHPGHFPWHTGSGVGARGDEDVSALANSKAPLSLMCVMRPLLGNLIFHPRRRTVLERLLFLNDTGIAGN